MRMKSTTPKFCRCFSELSHLYVEAITYQGGLARSLRKDRKSRPELEKAEERLKALKVDYLSDTGEEWSDVREEGPIILTKNIVRGCEFSPELTDIVKQLKKEEALRYPFYRRSLGIIKILCSPLQ